MKNINNAHDLGLLTKIVAKNWKKITLIASLPFLSMPAMAIEDHHAESVHSLSAEAAAFQDTNILAQELGVSPKEVKNSLAFQHKFEMFFKELSKKYPNKISRVWLESAPAQEAYIQFVGKTPMINTKLNIDMFGGGIYSFQEQEKRAVYLSRLLKNNNQTNFLTYFDHKTGLIKLEVKTNKRSKAMTPEIITQLLSNHKNQFDSDEKSIFNDLSINEIDYEIIEGTGDIYDFDLARGGEWLNNDEVNFCTSGWAVSGPNGNGIVTAAHCTGLDELDHHYTTSDPEMTFRSQERGNGDVEYHTTTHTEVAEYYAREDEVRDVTGVKWTFLMFSGQSVCEYGRSSNTRTCNHDVISNNVTATFTDGVTVNNLVRVTGDNSIGGDSGGPWSWGTVAWGVHSGSNETTSLFTPIQKAQSELNITVLTQ